MPEVDLEEKLVPSKRKKRQKPQSCLGRFWAWLFPGRAIYAKRPLLAIWLFLETIVDLAFGAVFIPNFYGVGPSPQYFMTTITLNQACMTTFQQDLSDDPSISSLRDAIHTLNTPDCQTPEPVRLCEEANRLLRSLSASPPNYSNGLLGVVLLICGFLAPMGEMWGRVIMNIIRLGLIETVFPRAAHLYEYLYENCHGFLQHLTQFKIFLVFTELLLSVDFFGIRVLSMTGSAGAQMFVLFTVWSIFLTTIVSKVEKTGRYDNLLPPETWLPKLLGSHTGSYRATHAIMNMIMLCGFFIFTYRSPFTFVINWKTRNTTHALKAMYGVEDADFYDNSYTPLIAGFPKMWHGGFKTMCCTIFFQVIVCNLIVPFVQLGHAFWQEFCLRKCGRNVGWNPDNLPQKGRFKKEDKRRKSQTGQNSEAKTSSICCFGSPTAPKESHHTDPSKGLSRICPNCRNTYADDALYCRQCGVKRGPETHLDADGHLYTKDQFKKLHGNKLIEAPEGSDPVPIFEKLWECTSAIDKPSNFDGAWRGGKGDWFYPGDADAYLDVVGDDEDMQGKFTVTAENTCTFEHSNGESTVTLKGELKGDTITWTDGDKWYLVENPKRRSLRGITDLIEILCFIACENQAHEFFLIAFAMMLHIVQGLIFERGHIPNKYGDINVSMCFNPLIILWFLIAVVLLGRPRAKLRIAMKNDSRKMRNPYLKRTDWIGGENFFLLQEMIITVVMVNVLVLQDASRTYLGEWTMSEAYVNGTYRCTTTNGHTGGCFRGHANNKTITDIAQILPLLGQSSSFSSMWTQWPGQNASDIFQSLNQSNLSGIIQAFSTTTTRSPTFL